MNDREAASVSVNYCVRDSEIEEFERLLSEADPGDWRVVDGEVQRYGGKPFERREASLRLMAHAVSAIPRLIRGIRVLEEALQNAWAATACARSECIRERNGRVEDAKRHADGRTGPEGEIEMIVRLAIHGEYTPQEVECLARQWAGGRSLGRFEQDAICAEQRAAERKYAQHEVQEQFQRDRAELTRLLEQARAGTLPVDVGRRARRSA